MADSNTSSDWNVGDIVTCERAGFLPRQFRVTSVKVKQGANSDVVEYDYTVRPLDGLPYWVRAGGDQ